MIRFQYDFFGDNVELQASDWLGLERVLLNGKPVSHKINFGPKSTHYVELKDGLPCRFQLLIDPQTDLLTCQIFKQNQLIASLKQGRSQLSLSRFQLDAGIILACTLLFTMYYWI
jgi:hypothetical protein